MGGGGGGGLNPPPLLPFGEGARARVVTTRRTRTHASKHATLLVRSSATPFERQKEAVCVRGRGRDEDEARAFPTASLPLSPSHSPHLRRAGQAGRVDVRVDAALVSQHRVPHQVRPVTQVGAGGQGGRQGGEAAARAPASRTATPVGRQAGAGASPSIHRWMDHPSPPPRQAAKEARLAQYLGGRGRPPTQTKWRARGRRWGWGSGCGDGRRAKGGGPTRAGQSRPGTTPVRLAQGGAGKVDGVAAAAAAAVKSRGRKRQAVTTAGARRRGGIVGRRGREGGRKAV